VNDFLALIAIINWISRCDLITTFLARPFFSLYHGK